MLSNWDVSMNWIDVDQDKDKWRAVMHAAVNFQFPQNVKKSLH
jgi:hypothetical protein